MIRALNIGLFLLSNLLLAQENVDQVYSTYFKVESFGAFKKVSNISSTYFQKYQPSNNEKNQMRLSAGENLIMDETGVYILKNKLLFITREQVREESKYSIRNGYLFGVVENDSVPVALDGERYYFLIPSKTYLHQPSVSNTILYQTQNINEFILANKEDNGHYTIILIRFKNNKSVSFCELNLAQDKCNFDMVKSKEIIKGDFNTYIISPTKDEWSKLLLCFDEYDSYEATN